MMNKFILFLNVFAFLFTINKTSAQEKSNITGHDSIPASVVSGLSFRGIGPAMTSGRISDFAVNPQNHNEYYVAVGSGNIWKTSNAGTTYKPVFDNYGAYAIGCLAMDPKNPNVVWAGTGENNHQRALGYGDGVYKTVDGGKSWKNMGLKDSRHIGMIAIHPDSTDVVYIAAEGSAWGPGGQRGLYKTTNGGETWDLVLEISENTGINNVILDPRYPNIIYATSEQRRRHVHTKIGGGPESGIHKSTDGGQTWKELKSGLPQVDMGGIGIAVSPVNPDVIYAIIEAQVDESGKNQSGFFRSTDRGESWSRMSDHHSSGQYYNEIFCDPKDVDKVYSVETYTHVTEDGGKTFRRISLENRHVDDHALWIDPEDTRHFLIGGDGGIYETWDGGNTFHFKTNLPVTQFYRVAVDNDYPFYNVYGGTQDNNTLGGPSQTLSSDGITSEDWFATLGGDGFWPGIDPDNPNILYSEYQYGNIYRIDKVTGEQQYIKPMPAKGENTFRWNWNTPFILSPHNSKRLYIAANKVFRSDDRGDSWTRISDDLTAGIDRNTWPVMGRYWSTDAVVKDVSTSLYGTIVSIDESPLQENLLYIGTDDGVIQVTEDAATWRKIAKFPGVPEHTYVSDLRTSKHDAETIFAAFDNRKRDDFSPYLLKSTDKGKSWESIAGNLPENETVHSIQQDHVHPDLLFAGTEFGVYFTINGGKSWTKLGSGLPTISVRDIEIQERENDLVLATFGRGFYILDDYSALRNLTNEVLEKEAHIFPVEEAKMYMLRRGKYGQGTTFFKADNPQYGAVFTYYLKEVPKTQRQERWLSEEDLIEKNERIPQPTKEALRSEEFEEKPMLLFTVYDEEGNVIRRIKTPPRKGINRMNWDLRYSSFRPITKVENGSGNNRSGFMAMPGKYSVKLEIIHQRNIIPLVGPTEFEASVLKLNALQNENPAELVAFQKEIAKLGNTIYGTYEYVENLEKKLKLLEASALQVNAESNALVHAIYDLQKQINDIQLELYGTPARASAEEVSPEPVSIASRLSYLMRRQWSSTAPPTQTERDNFNILQDEFPPLLERIQSIAEEKIPEIEESLDGLHAPWTPGRKPAL